MFVRSTFRPLLAAGLLLPLAASLPASAQSISFSRIGRPIIESRLKAVTPDNAARYEALKKMFEQAGCTGDRLTEQKVKGSKLPNIVCTLPGKTKSTLVVGAHYDAADPAHAVVDNWTGAALLPSLYQSLNKNERNHTFVFVAFSGNAKGMKGSKQFAKKMGKNVKAMVNLDSLGLSPTKVWVTENNKHLTSFIAGVAKAIKVPVTGVNVEAVGQGDAIPFNDRKIPTLVIHSLDTENHTICQSDQDTLEAVDRNEYYNTYSLTAATLAFMDIKLD